MTFVSCQTFNINIEMGTTYHSLKSSLTRCLKKKKKPLRTHRKTDQLNRCRKLFKQPAWFHREAITDVTKWKHLGQKNEINCQNVQFL